MATAATNDPILSLIEAYLSALHYCESVEGLDDDAYQTLASKTHYPLREALIRSTEVATSAEGARAALNLAIHEYRIGASPLIERMMQAAAGYLATA